MNYGVMYEFVVNRDSGQWKAPFNEISNEARVFTYKDTSVVTPNSDTPYSMLWLDLRAEPMVLSVPAVPRARSYSVQLVDAKDMENVKTGFFEFLDFALQFAPPGPEEVAIRAKVARIVMRLYWPRTEPPSILPPGEGSWQPPPLQKVAGKSKASP